MLNSKINTKELLRIMMSDLKTLFPENYFPQFEVMDEGDVYINGTKWGHDMVAGKYLYKYFLFNAEGKLLFDAKYPYTRFIPEGYLLKVKVDSPIQAMNYKVEYCVKVNDVECEENVTYALDANSNTVVVKNTIMKSVQNYTDVLSKEFTDILHDTNKFFDTYINN